MVFSNRSAQQIFLLSLLLLTAPLVFAGEVSQDPPTKVVISGKVKDADTGEDLLFATVSVVGTTIGTTTNEYGFYSLTLTGDVLAQAEIKLLYTYLGYVSSEKKVPLAASVQLDVALSPESTKIEEVVVSASKQKQKEELKSAEMSTIRLQMKAVKNLPSLGGEVDLVKVVQLLPGVTSGNQGTTGMLVRGGSADQNLVLLDEATVYNVGHLFGFFSVFNSEAIRDVTMVKGAFGANYGGRLSSILDVRMKEGNLQNYHAQGGIGLLASRIMLEGPIKKEEASFVVAARRSYVDHVLRAAGLKVPPYYFYDLNAKANYILNEHNRLFYSFYYGQDKLSLSKDADEEDIGINFGFNLNNLTNTLRWNHLFSQKLFSNFSLIHTNFAYDILGTLGSKNIFVGSSIFDLGAKLDFDYFRNNSNHIRFGASVVSHHFKPNVVSTSQSLRKILPNSKPQNLISNEFAVYAHSDKDFTKWLRVKYGARLTGSLVTGKTYVDVEPRLALRVLLSENDALKLSVSKMNQYMHRVSSSSVSLPTDLWYPITQNITPQSSYLYSGGLEHLFETYKTKVGIEAYYKTMTGLIEFKEGANVIFNNNFEAELLQGKGTSYGYEFFVKRDEGRFTGWVGYTLAWATRQFDGLNKGKEFPSKFDRRHVISLVGSYHFSKRLIGSAVWEYQSGARFTAQVGQHVAFDPAYNVNLIPIYSDRNAISLSPSHRLDVSLTWKGRTDRRFSGDWSVGIYNLYNYAQPYKIKVVKEGNSFRYTQPGLFGLLPSISYNFNFTQNKK